MKVNLMDVNYESVVFVLAALQNASILWHDPRNIRRAGEAYEDLARAAREADERRTAWNYIARLGECRTEDSG